MEAGRGMSDWAAREKVLLQENDDLAFAHALQEHEWADATTQTHRWRSKCFKQFPR
jgi:hypothetical protein